ncbi:hypothetical protein K438DRAFT_1785310 [Mycena galopus ATCC 62051]|nr:hypothetical protein K438DRAFT_1785310 [Mycena galopus ATCC 62051]
MITDVELTHTTSRTLMSRPLKRGRACMNCRFLKIKYDGMKPICGPELLPSLLAVVAAIPNHTLRYTALCFFIAVAVLCSIHLRSPTTQIRLLAVLIDQTEEYIRRAMVQNPRSYLSLTDQMSHLLESTKTASSLKCRILNSPTERLSWNKYWLLSGDIGECRKGIKKIRTAVQLILEAEHQRKLTDDILEIQFILTASNTGSRTTFPTHTVLYQTP